MQLEAYDFSEKHRRIRTMKRRLYAAAVTGITACLAAGMVVAFALYPANGFLGYTYNKWGDPAVGTGAVVYWSLMPPGTSGSDYCQSACQGSSTLTLPNFYDWNTHTFNSVQLSDPAILATIQNAMNTWATVANVTFRYLASDSGVPINDPAAEPPGTGHIRIGVFNTGFSGPAAVAYAPPPNGFIPNTSQLATGAGDIIFNSEYAYQNPAGNEGDPLNAFPAGGGFYLNDFEGLLLHEIGHALGVAHSDVADAVMCGYPHACIYDSPATYAINRKPGSDDVLGIRTVYGAAPDTDGDGAVDSLDNCSALANASQVDSDDDGFGNRCDADLNNNSATNSQDYILFRQRLGQPSAPPDYDIGDFNANGAVNSQDYVLFRQLLGQPPGPSGYSGS